MKRKDGVADGTRTHDNRNHNPGLYQLSYSHHRKRSDYSQRSLAAYAIGRQGVALDAAIAAAMADALISTLKRFFSVSR